MEVRRATAPARSSDSSSSSSSSGRAGRAQQDRPSPNGAAANGWTATEELSKRRLANDPAMMRELRRYQRLMLLTLLPAITTGDADHARAHPHAHAHHRGHAALLLQPRGQPEGAEGEPKDRNPSFSDHLPRPEATDGFPGVASRRSPQQQVRSAGSQGERGGGAAAGGKNLPSGPASAGTRLPLAVYNPLESSSPLRHASHRRRSHDDATSPRRRRRRRRRRRKSHGDDQEEEEEEEEVEEEEGTAGVVGGGGGGGVAASGELDMLTLAALYLESRHRVFGQEWHHRPDSRSNSRPGVAPAQVGATGVARPRRLTPLSPTNNASDADQAGREPRTFSAVMPTPAGLHLSVNYTQNLGLEESTYLAERARALRPRLRRLNSMDDLLPGASSHSRELQKATSAPDLSDGGHGGGRRTIADTMSRISSMESISPPLVTPARANTPTEARHSAALARPQIVGGSLATCSAVDAPSSALMAPTSARLLHLPETSRAVLPPAKLPYRPHPMALAEPKIKKDLERQRKGGRIHLQPLSMRKSSE